MNKKTALIAVLFLLVHFLLVVYCIKANSPTCDEIAHHVASGYSYLQMRDFRMNPANPPLIREISAFPLLFLDLRAPLASDSWVQGNSPVFGRQFFYELNNNSDEIIFWARAPIASLSVILGFLVFLWASMLYGEKAGLLSVALYSFSPNIMAFAGLATVDLGAALFIFAALFSFWYYLKKPCFSSLALAGICFGLAQASKYTSVFLAPIFILLGIAVFIFGKKQDKDFKVSRVVFPVIVIFIIGAVVLSATYFFEVKPLLKNAPDLQEKIDYIKTFVDKYSLSKIGLSQEKAIDFAINKPIPFSAYIVGLLGVLRQGVVGLDTFLLGQHSQSGFWNYFLVAFFVKSTPIFIVLFFASVGLLFTNKAKETLGELFILVPVAIFFIIVSISKVQVGVRHILYVYPLLFVFAGKINATNINNSIKYALIVIVACLQIFSLSKAYPYPIAYFNEIAGGPNNGYKILRDSNLDWGQGLKALKEYMDKNNIKKVKLYYFGTASPDYYKIHYENLKESEFKTPEKGTYAISAQYLDAVKWAKDHEPVKKIAYSIFVYEF